MAQLRGAKNAVHKKTTKVSVKLTHVQVEVKWARASQASQIECRNNEENST